MQVIPVLDLMIGQVVLAQGGSRDEYRPVHSRLTGSSQPLDVAQAIFNQTGCNWLYVADIDSFAEPRQTGKSISNYSIAVLVCGSMPTG